MVVLRHTAISLIIAASVICAAAPADASELYSASLKSGNYGGGFIVDTFSSCSDPDGSSCGDGDLSNMGITNTPDGVLYTLSNAVINYSIGRDYGTSTMNSFRSHGTVSVRFNADLQTFVNGQPFTDNYGFNQFRSGQGTFGTGMSRNTGADATSGTADDRVSIGWSTWNSNVWYNHVQTPVLLTFDQWHYLGFAWDDTTNKFDIWVDGLLVSSDTTNNVPPWGSAAGLGNPYNFALGEIHERIYGNSSPYGVMFSDLTIWDEYRPLGGTAPAKNEVPEPSSLLLLGIGLLGFVSSALRRRTRFH